MVYYIYKMIHVPTGRVYIGQRKLRRGTPETDGYTGSGKIWKRIYNKHQDECVKVVIDTCSTRAEADSLECKYIAHYKSVMGEYCVNIDSGGYGGSQPGDKNPFFGKRHSEESRAKMSAALKGKNTWMKGKHRSGETRSKISATLKGRVSPTKGKHHSEETRSKMSAALKGRVSPTKGKHFSDESRRKISEARKAYWARKRELTGKEGI